jgi:hypothetical protein
LNTARFQIIDLIETTFPELAQLHHYWLNKKPIGQMAPAWQDIDMIDLPPSLLPRMCVVDVDHEKPDFTYRFWGTAITDMHHYDLTQKSVRDLTPEHYAACIFQQYEEILMRQAPQTFLTEVPRERLSTTYYAALRVPLSSDNQRITQIMSAEHYGEQRDDLKDLFEEIYRNA